jgi:hypothetical protein
MNIVLNINNFDIINVSFLEKKDNTIVEGVFSKIIYTDEYITLNGIFLDFPLEIIPVEKNNNKNYLYFTLQANHALIAKIQELENILIEYYNIEKNICKRNVSNLYNQLLSGKIKIFNNSYNSRDNHIVLKISGLWETANEIGITYKFVVMNNI